MMTYFQALKGLMWLIFCTQDRKGASTHIQENAMENELRNSGIDVLGDVTWGTHLCQFFENKQDLLNILVPYFKAGLESNEFCLWIPSHQLTQEEAVQTLRQAVPELDHYLTKQCIEILPSLKGEDTADNFTPKDIISIWEEKLHEARARGFEGIRINGNACWQAQEKPGNFMGYEEELNRAIKGQRMLVLCTYPLSQIDNLSLLAMAHVHVCAISKQNGRWELLGHPGKEEVNAKLKSVNENLERKVKERTRQMEEANRELIRELTERRKTEDRISREKQLSDEIIDSIPGVFQILDENLRFLRWNRQLEIVTGYSANEIRNLHVDDFYDADDREKKYKELDKIIINGTNEDELPLRLKDGRKLIYYFIGRLINYEGRPCIICTGIDLTERKKAEEMLQQSYQQIRQLNDHLQNIREDERTRIAREIHDEMGQLLTVMKLDVTWLVEQLRGTEELIKNRLENLRKLLDSTVTSVKKISYELRPPMLDELGLAAAMEWYLKEFEIRSGIRTYFHKTEEEPLLSEAVKNNLYRIFQESLTNVLKYSGASQLEVYFEKENGAIILRIKDNGKGFSPESIREKRTFGILGMKERTVMMGGQYDIQSSPGKGTTVNVSVPL